MKYKTISWEDFKLKHINERYKRSYGIIKRIKYKKNMSLNYIKKLFRGELDV